MTENTERSEYLSELLEEYLQVFGRPSKFSFEGMPPELMIYFLETFLGKEITNPKVVIVKELEIFEGRTSVIAHYGATTGEAPEILSCMGNKEILEHSRFCP